MKRATTRALAHRRGSAGFTLVELLVAMTVLSIIVLALSSLMGFVAQTWLSGVNASNNFAKARTMLTVIDRDTQTMILRRDLGAFSDQAGTGSLCAFYTEEQGQPGSDTRTISLVQYSLKQTPTGAPTNSVLERLNSGMNYSSMTPSVGYNTNLVQLGSPAVTALPVDDVANGVIAFQWQFIDGTGGLLTPPYVPAGVTGPPPPTPIPFSFNFVNQASVSNPRTLVISLVVVSDSTYQTAIQNGTLGKLAALFPSTMPGTQTTTVGNTNYTKESFAQLWSGILNPTTGTFAMGQNLPPAEIGPGRIQVFERHIPLPLTTPSN